jgi:Hexapeptide repeat of succinyl-transferase
MGKQDRLLQKLDAVINRRTDGPRVVCSRVTFGDGRLRRKYETRRARRNVAPYLSPPRVTVGRYTFGEPQIPNFAGADVSVEIGSFCSIAANVMLLLGGGHDTSCVSTWPIREVFGLPGQYEHHPVYRGPTVIGNDVWIGRDAIILDGITIGHGAVIGTRAVVTKDVRPYAVVAGVPAREIRRRFTDEEVDALLEIGWWDWPIEKIIREAGALNGADINEFLERHSVSYADRLVETA